MCKNYNREKKTLASLGFLRFGLYYLYYFFAQMEQVRCEVLVQWGLSYFQTIVLNT